MVGTNLVDDSLLNFVVEHTKHFDESHNYVHALRVTNNAHIIMKSIREDYDERLLSFAAMLHDVYNDKCQDTVPKEVLSDFIKTNLSIISEPIVMKIINNISFSKEDNDLQDKLPKPYDQYLVAICDADRLEALSKVGLNRYIELTKSKGGKIPDDIIKYCEEKLLRLLPENFIKTNIAREMASQLHEEIYNYVYENDEIFA